MCQRLGDSPHKVATYGNYGKAGLGTDYDTQEKFVTSAIRWVLEDLHVNSDRHGGCVKVPTT